MSKNSSPYHEAGWLLNEHLEKRRGIKSIAFEGGKKRKNDASSAPDKRTYATVCKTMQHLSTINEVLNADGGRLRKAIGFDSVRNKGLLYVMLHELLYGIHKSIRGGGKIKRMITKHEKELRRKAEECVGKKSAAVNFPRYVRVNTLRSSVSDVVDRLKTDLAAKSDEGTEGGDSPQTASVYADAHVPDLLVLPPSASSWLHQNHELVKDGKIVLQDKSSCFSALVLARGLGGSNDTSEQFDYIDACSAPGNKTSHLAMLVSSAAAVAVEEPTKKKKKGKASKASMIYAFERSSTRFNVLSQRMEQLVNGSGKGTDQLVVPTHGDFLKADPSDPKFANVRAIMLDPSCSGSGIVNSPDRWLEDDGVDAKKDDKRIQSLSNFQLVALKHAMSFPNVDRIVYSTCSVHDEENEAVVSKALSEAGKSDDNEEDDENEWVLAAPVCLEHWPRRGKEGGIGGLTKSQADCLVRCDGLDGDETNGFFVSFFVRKRVLARGGTEKTSLGSSMLAESHEDIPVYNGEFADAVAGANDAPESPSSDGEQLDDEKTASQKPTQSKKSKSKSKESAADKKSGAPAATKAADKSAKKREKKMAWKRKQALLKSERLKKKEGK